MPFGLLEGIGLGSTIIGGIGSMFGDDGQDQLKKALAEAKRISQTGIDPQTMARLRQSRQNLASNEISGQRASAASRLQRQGAPVQIQEQILGDITQKGLLARQGGMAELDLMNEQVKSRALNQFIQGSAQLKGSGEGFASLFGSGLNLLGESDFFTGEESGGQGIFSNVGGGTPGFGVKSDFGLDEFDLKDFDAFGS